jgi:polyphosphate kinase
MTDGPDLSDPSLYINRELSWLAFNQRVLAQAKSDAHPLLERVKFLSIAANNLDEFFMVRVATLARQRRSGLEHAGPDGLTAGQCLTMVRTRGESMLRDIADCWEQTLRPLLRAEDIVILEASDYSPQVQEFLQEYLSQRVCPVLTPLAFDPGHPFPYISNRSKNFAVVVESKGRTRFARVKVPDVLPRFVAVPPAVSGRRGLTFALLEDVIRPNLCQLFPGMDIADAHLFRVIRETDIVLQEDEAVDLLESVDQGLREIRHGQLSLLQVDAEMPARVLDILAENFEVERDVVMQSSTRLGFADWMSLTNVERPKLKDTPFVPRAMWHRQDPEAIFDQIKYRDTLLHHPFDSFTTFEAFLDAAVRDEHVVAIKMTLYRVGNKSPLVERLMEAADDGALRRAQQHRVGFTAGGSRRPRGVWTGEPEDALQAVPRRSQRGRRDSAVRAHRHRQLQPRHVSGLHRLRAVHGQPANRGRRLGSVQLSDRLFQTDDLPRADRRACRAARAADEPDRA